MTFIYRKNWTNQQENKKKTTNLSISRLPHASNHIQGPYIAMNLAFIIKDPDNTLCGLRVGSCGSQLCHAVERLVGSQLLLLISLLPLEVISTSVL